MPLDGAMAATESRVGAAHVGDAWHLTDSLAYSCATRREAVGKPRAFSWPGSCHMNKNKNKNKSSKMNKMKSSMNKEKQSNHSKRRLPLQRT
jgi:hypothetical protein